MPWMTVSRLLVKLRRRRIDPRGVLVYFPDDADNPRYRPTMPRPWTPEEDEAPEDEIPEDDEYE